MNTAIQINSLSKIYHKKHAPEFFAVNDLNLTIPAGQLFGFLGPNGAGKTTTIKMICGLITPSHGTITINGYDAIKDRFNAMQQIGAVLEGARNVYWQLSAWENLLYFARLKGVAGHEVKERAAKLLHTLKLWERKDDNVGTFSRGMQQKVAIACALIADPPIILLDEPTLGLDIHAAHTVKELILQLAHEQKKTIVLTTHQLDIAEQLCERIAIIRGGRIIIDSSINELLHLFHEEYYTVTIEGHIKEPLPYPDKILVAHDGDKTQFSFALDQPEILHTLLQTIHKLDLPLHSVTKSKQSLEQVFVRLLEEQGNV